MPFLNSVLKKIIFQNGSIEKKTRTSGSPSPDWDKLWVRSKSGGIISASFTHSGYSIPNSIIILVPPISTISKNIYYNSVLVNNFKKTGKAVITFDYNGFGESTTGNFNYIYDFLAVVQKTWEIFTKLPTIVVSLVSKDILAIIKIDKLDNPSLEYVENLLLSDNILQKNLAVNRTIYSASQYFRLTRQIKINKQLLYNNKCKLPYYLISETKIIDIKSYTDELNKNNSYDPPFDKSEIAEYLTQNRKLIVECVNSLIDPPLEN